MLQRPSTKIVCAVTLRGDVSRIIIVQKESILCDVIRLTEPAKRVSADHGLIHSAGRASLIGVRTKPGHIQFVQGIIGHKEPPFCQTDAQSRDNALWRANFLRLPAGPI